MAPSRATFLNDYTITEQANAFIFGDDCALAIEVDNSGRLADDMLI